MAKIEPKDPHRIALAAAIEERDVANDVATRSQTALQRAKSLVETVTAKHAEALADIEAALESKTLAAIESTSGDAVLTKPTLSVGAARARLVAVEDELAAARNAFARLQQSNDDPHWALSKAEAKVNDCVEAILIGEIDRMIADATVATRTAEACRISLITLMRSIDSRGAHRPAYDRINDYMAQPPFPAIYGNRIASNESAMAWSAAIEQLRMSSNAKLPES